MKILYSAIDQAVPGSKGGSVHVAAVAEGLAALGHEVTALITPGPGQPRPSPVRWVEMPPPFGSRFPTPSLKTSAYPGFRFRKSESIKKKGSAVAVTATQMGLSLSRIETALNVDRALDLYAAGTSPRIARR